MKESTDFILIKDNIFTEKECEDMINTYQQNLQQGEKELFGYSFCDIEINTFKNNHKLQYIIDEYKKTFQDINKTASIWQLNNLRFKHFKPQHSFSSWHSEHCFSNPYRVLSLQIYLSNHNCGTEFSNYDKTIKSDIGKVVLFPAYFTHTHRGQICPENKDRYIITGYVNFIQKGKLEQ